MNHRIHKKIHRIVITPGEPAGIGPDVVIMALKTQKIWSSVELVICGDSNLLINRAKKLNLSLHLDPYDPDQEPIPGKVSVLHISLNDTVVPGKLTIKNNSYIINTLTRSTIGCINKEFSALVTGPVNKTILNQGGILFTGHTEFLAKISNSKKTVMIFDNKKFRIALATTHIPISFVSQSITQELLSAVITIVIQGLQQYFKILFPKIYVCGLNPHAGESGYIGKEEIETIIPILHNLRKKYNYNIIGPLPADTIFQAKYLCNSDIILSMYHDQILPVLKYAAFNQSVNITFGLPFIRTSVDHGSAVELSGTGKAKPDSMIHAIISAINMIKNSHEKNKL